MKTSDVVAPEKPGLAIVKNAIKQANTPEVFSVINNMNRALSVAAQYDITIQDLPELGELLEKHKTAWITSLLHAIKDPEGTSLAKLQVKNLLKVGIRWPELGIMNKSLSTLKEGPDNSIGPVTIERFMNEMKHGNPYSAHHFFIILTRSSKPENDKIKIAEALKSEIPLLTRFILYVLPGPGTASNMIDMIASLPMGIFADVKDQIDLEKPKIIKFILHNLKDLAYLDASDTLNILKRFNIKWPELEIIKKSIDADKPNRLLEGSIINAMSQLKALIAQMKEAFAYVRLHPLANVFPLNTVARFKRMHHEGLLSIDEIAPKLDLVKDDTIKYMLASIKSERGVPFDIMHWIDDLRRLGVTWPELDVIEKSYQADRKKLKEDFNDEFDNPSDEVYIEWFIQEMIAGKPYAAYECMNKLIQLNIDKVEIAKVLNTPRNLEFLTKYVIYRLWNRTDLMHETVEFLATLPMGILDNVKAKINNEKDKLIKYMLEDIRDGYYTGADGTIKVFKYLKLQWPELDIIQKSIKANTSKEISENYENDDIYNYENIVKQLLVLILADEGYDYIDRQNTVILAARKKRLPELCEKYKLEMLEKLEEHICSSEPYNVNNGLHRMCSLANIGCNWPELRVLLDDYKKNIIKQLLIDIKEGADSYYVDMLKPFKLNWPELIVINKSLAAEKEAHPDELQETVVGMSRLEAERFAKQAMVKLVSDVKSDSTHCVRHAVSLMIQAKIPGDIIKNVFENNKDWVLLDIKGSITRQFMFKYNTMSLTLDGLVKLKWYGIDFPEIRKFIDDRRKSIVKYILQLIKDGGYDVEEAEACVSRLTELKYTWPELPVIKKSLDASNTDHINESTESNIITHIGKLHLGVAANMVRVNKLTANNNPDIVKAFEDNKEKLIRYLLNTFAYLEDSPPDLLENLKLIVDAFIQFGLDWPELAVINKSLNAGNPESLNESFRDPQSIMKYLNELLDSNFDISTDVGECFKQLASSNVKLPNELKAKLIKDKDTVLDALRVIAADQLIDRLLDIFTWLKVNGLNWKELTLENFKRVIIRTLLVSARHMADTHTLMTLKQLSDLRVHWPELNAIRKSVEATVAHKTDQARRAEIDEAVPTAKGPAKIPTGGGPSVANPAHMRSVKYEGDPAKFDFGLQKRNYDIISAALARQNKKLEYIGVARSAAGPDIFVATAPGVVWYKYVGTNPQSGQNYMYINGAKVKTSWFVTQNPSMQDRILTSDKVGVTLLFTDKLQDIIRAFGNARDPSALDGHKAQIISKILDMIKSGNSWFNGTDEAMQCVVALKAAGVKWPELAILDRSLKFEISRNKENEIDEQASGGSTQC